MKETKYLSKEYTNCLRGIFAILVVAHHLYQYGGLFRGMHIGAVFQLFGFIAVAAFFFFSGYGLMLSANKKNYINQFIGKRFLPLYCFYVFLIILYTLWTLLFENKFSITTFFQSFFFGKTVVTNGWYLQATFITYLLYFLVFKVFKSSKTRLIFFGVGVLIYCVCCNLLDLGITWYQNVPCMLLGMVYCTKKDFFDTLLKKFAWLAFIVFGILFGGCFILSSISGIDIIFNVLYSLFFVLTTISFAYILSGTPIIENKFTKLCGDYSLEIYVAHGLFLKFMKLGYIKNVYIYIPVVIVGTIVCAIVFKKIYLFFVSLFKKINP